MIHWFRVQAESDPSPSRVRSESELSPIRVRAESEASPIRFRAESEPSPSRVQTESELSPMRALAESTTASEASPSRSSGQPEPWPSRVRVRSDPLPPPNPAGSDSEPCRRRVRAVALLTAVLPSPMRVNVCVYVILCIYNCVCVNKLIFACVSVYNGSDSKQATELGPYGRRDVQYEIRIWIASRWPVTV